MRDIARITTDQLLLRPLRLSDAGAVVAGAGNYDVAKWLAVVPFPYDETDARDFLLSPAAQARRAWAICEKAEDGALCGIVSIGDELGYWLARGVWGRGYAREAARAAVDAAFADPTRSWLRVSHMVGNERSEKVIRGLGFRYAGTEPRTFRALGQKAETAIYRMTRSDWRRLRREERRGRATA